MIAIRLLRINHGHSSKIKRRSNGHAQFQLYLYSLSSTENVFLDVLSNQTILTYQSLNFLLSSASRLISASKEWLKVRFRQKNKEISPLEF